MKITKSKKRDLEEILDLQKLAYIQEAELYENLNISPLHDTLGHIEKEFEEKIIFKATIEGKISGSIRAYPNNGTVFISKLIIHPEAQNKGFGRKLMLYLELQFPNAKRFELFTAHKSLKNLHLYSSLGYKEFKREKLESNPDMIFLEKMT
jgi:ribosomal protein S18 acetylase RimI-like enzyme